MRVFKKYAPVMIARHVVLLFKGSFFIQGIGEFAFDCGKVVIGKTETINDYRLKVCREVNEAIFSMTGHLRLDPCYAPVKK